MNSKFFNRLAGQNLRKNSAAYGPYILASILTVAMFYMICSLSRNPGLPETFGGEALQTILTLGVYVVGLFAVIFLFYTNSFLIKRRKREFGLFNVLGLEKRHLAIVIGLETVYTALLSILAGLIVGVALDKAMFLLVRRVLGLEVALGFYISWNAVLVTVILFAAIFFLIFVNCIRQVYVARPVELLRAENAGEREPKAKWLIALVGIVCLGGGYYIAIVTTDVIQAMLLFFVAVVLVIIGTYCLFTAGSITMLKLLRKNKRYYYKSRHFTAVSGMMYRMKQNAVGLANICILSTMVLVMLSGTICLMVGMEDALMARYPYDVEVPLGNEESGALVRDALVDGGFEIENEVEYTYFTFLARRVGDQFGFLEEYEATLLDGEYTVIVTTLEDYVNSTGDERTLSDGEALLCVYRDTYDLPTATIMGITYDVTVVDDHIQNGDTTANLTATAYLVLPDMKAMDELNRAQAEIRSEKHNEYYNQNVSVEEYMSIRQYYGFDIAGGNDEELAARDAIAGAWHFSEGVDLAGTYNIRAYERQGVLALYGGLFFLGIFLGTLFTMAAILIIYYKQISEGHDDRRRFEIMQKVGMSRLEVKRTIHSQVLIVFFLPLVMAGIHVGFAYPILDRVLLLFNLMNPRLFIWSIVCCFGAFAVIYAIVYALTARTYYKLVST